ncbi:MAG TPA: putative toxin-antitoxin system toxin component, PIN family [Gammaproteobacteria bacterium]|nr:putative toxin-antitoxin system toxin component, PIN family [Gammaproteobacteria bacterium]
MAKPRIVLDTNVLVAALRSRRGAAFRILSLVGTGLFETLVSVPLVFEYEDVLAREAHGITESATSDVIDYICKVSHPQEIQFLWRPFLKDPKDDFVLELAVAARSATIVTFNVRDFEGSSHFGVRVLRPVELLSELGVDL